MERFYCGPSWPGARQIKTLCPKCETTHIEHIYWTGRASTPRIYCQACLRIVAFCSTADMTYRVDIDLDSLPDIQPVSTTINR